MVKKAVVPQQVRKKGRGYRDDDLGQYQKGPSPRRGTRLRLHGGAVVDDDPVIGICALIALRDGRTITRGSRADEEDGDDFGLEVQSRFGRTVDLLDEIHARGKRWGSR